MPKKRKKTWKIIRISLVNVLVMLFLTYYWLSLPRTFGDEAFFIKWSSLVRKSLLGMDKKPNPEEVIFIDISGNKTTMNDPEAISFLPDAGYHRMVLTDRKELADLFDIMAKYKDDIRYVFCDVLFKDSTVNDSTLENAFLPFENKALTVSHLENRKNKITPVIDVPHALATYQAVNGLFLKFPLVLNDSLKTVPLKMYEMIHDKTFEKWGPFYFIDNKLSLPSPIVDYKVRLSDFRTGSSLKESNYAVYPLGTILESAAFMDEASLGSYFKGKIVLIGDLKTDMHETPFGKAPGLLLIYNAYLSLEAQQHEIRFLWILFLSISFFILSYRIFADIKVKRPKWLVRIFKTQVGQYILNALDEMGLLVTITLLSYFLFNIHINILIFFVYLKVVEWIWKKMTQTKKAPKAVIEN